MSTVKCHKIHPFLHICAHRYQNDLIFFYRSGSARFHHDLGLSLGDLCLLVSRSSRSASLLRVLGLYSCGFGDLALAPLVLKGLPNEERGAWNLHGIRLLLALPTLH